MQARAQWFADNVTARELRFDGSPVELTLHVWRDDGSFMASWDGATFGSLARRPRSDDWWDLGMSEVTHRWSDERWDWALLLLDPWSDEPAPDEQVRTVRAWLASD